VRSLRSFAADSSVLGLAALDFNLVGVRVELGTETEGFALQREVDQSDGLIGLLLGGTVRDLVGVELKVQTPDGDGLHAASELTKANAASLLRMPMTWLVAAGTGWVNTTLQRVFTKP